MFSQLSCRVLAFLTAVTLALLVASGGHSQVPDKSLPYDYADMKESYANSIHLTQTPEELFIDFGVNINHPGPPKDKVKMTHRIAVSPYTAKRLQMLLNQAIERHEKTFGPIELDAQKRAKNPPADPPAA
jgi:hypothetical protein